MPVNVGFLQWMPEWGTALLLLVLAIGLALAIYRVVTHLVMRSLRRQSDRVSAIARRLKGPARLTLIILALSLYIRIAPLHPSLAAPLSHLLLLAVIVLSAWIASRIAEGVTAVHMKRYRMDVEDNLLARKHATQIRIVRQTINIIIGVVAAGAMLMTFEGVRQYGVSLLASAGAAGIILGLAAQPVLSNLVAGLQLAVTQPIRLDDAVVVEGEWGWIEDITSTYVVIRIWDWRRLVVPLRYFIDNPFENWTREQASIIGSVLIYADYSVPVGAVRKEAERIVRESTLWDGQVVTLQVTEAREATVELRVLVSARNSGRTFDLRCEVREKLLDFIQAQCPGALPRQRLDLVSNDVARK